jgi:hypothetical protein
MASWVTRMLSWPGNAFSLGEADASDFAATCRVARRMSLQKANHGAVVVVVELFAKFNCSTGEYEDRRYNFYTHRGTGDFNNMKNLKAAYVNGERVDKGDLISCGRLVVHEERVTAIDNSDNREASTARYRPIAWDEAEFSGSHLMPSFDATAADCAEAVPDSTAQRIERELEEEEDLDPHGDHVVVL